MAIKWLVVVIGASVTYQSSFNVYSPLFPPYQLGRIKHLILNLNMVNNDITQMQCMVGCVAFKDKLSQKGKTSNVLI